VRLVTRSVLYKFSIEQAIRRRQGRAMREFRNGEHEFRVSVV